MKDKRVVKVQYFPLKSYKLYKVMYCIVSTSLVNRLHS